MARHMLWWEAAHLQLVHETENLDAVPAAIDDVARLHKVRRAARPVPTRVYYPRVRERLERLFVVAMQISDCDELRCRGKGHSFPRN